MVNVAMKRILSVVTRNIICVHVGQKYSNEYVEKLYRACMRNSTIDFTFTILHDNKNYNINGQNLRYVKVEPMNFLGSHNLWWYKMQAFRSDVAIADQNLLLDLDLVIVNSLEKFWNYHPLDFVIIQDFNRQWFSKYNRSNSSVVKFTPQLAKTIYDNYMQNPLNYSRKFRGDQDYFDEYVENKVRWPKKWAMSWKWEVYNGGMTESNSNKYFELTTNLDLETSILVFHGKPDPHDINDPLINNNWI